MRILNNSLRSLLGILLVSGLLHMFSVPVAAAGEPIARLTNYSGTVLIKSQGNWGVQPKNGLLLYSQDRLVTRAASRATVIFNDGAVMAISSNSNLMIKEQTRTKGFFKRYTVIERRIRLLLGRLNFNTGQSKSQIQLETPTAVAGLRGTAGVLSIGADGQPYIQFSEGGASFTIGQFLDGVAAEIPAEMAELHVVQRAAVVANAAAVKAADAQAKAETGEIPAAQAALEVAIAAKTSAEEAKTEAVTMAENNPSESIVTEAAAAITAADQAIKQAEDAISDAASKAVPTEPPAESPDATPDEKDATPAEPEAFEPATTPTFETPLGDEAPPINDAVEASPI